MNRDFETVEALAAHLWNEHGDTRYVGRALEIWEDGRRSCPTCDVWIIDVGIDQ